MFYLGPSACLEVGIDQLGAGIGFGIGHKALLSIVDVTDFSAKKLWLF